MNSGKGSTILLMVIAVVTLLVAVAGTTFAYFGATMKDKDGETKIEVTSGTLSVEYDTNSQIKGTNLNFNDVLVNKTFTVTGVITGSSNLNYEANIAIKNNTFKDGDLVYTLTSENVSNNGSTIANTTKQVAIPSGASTISLGKGLFAGPTTAGSTHKYTLNIMYVNNNNSITPDLTASIDAKLNVVQTSSK